ncbi:hypothetical protein BD289DRAFT_85732 [Coniella lustricola]|uniref:Uncharacterized protein n=1 Tax=Coniella lustricola TaxID=2025994 RepID=A0A2T2ZYS5_9PEZI|nr:hypothetical protein BD289DRAFT_85732 [Coniella lustricola]
MQVAAARVDKTLARPPCCIFRPTNPISCWEWSRSLMPILEGRPKVGWAFVLDANSMVGKSLAWMMRRQGPFVSLAPALWSASRCTDCRRYETMDGNLYALLVLEVLCQKKKGKKGKLEDCDHVTSAGLSVSPVDKAKCLVHITAKMNRLFGILDAQTQEGLWVLWALAHVPVDGVLRPLYQVYRCRYRVRLTS